MLVAGAIAGDSSLCQWQDERTQRSGGISMEPSSDVAGTVTRFWEAIERGTVAAFDDVISSDPVAMVIGTDRWLGDRATWREAFPNLRGITVEGSGARGFRHGDSGWVVDRPVFVLPGGGRLPARLTAVAIQENDSWMIVAKHARRKLANKLVKILHGGLRHHTPYNERTAWRHWLPDTRLPAAA